jgi:inorganic pyrophosphatase
MQTQITQQFVELLSMTDRAHPWHGVAAEANGGINAFIEMIEGDEFKRELDKPSGILRVDRARRLSSACPFPYGFIPQTYCGKRVGELCVKATNGARKRVKGDGDPLDLFVLTSHRLPAPDVLLKVRPIGGFRMIDRGEADDKIIAVHDTDEFFDDIHDIRDVPQGVIDKLEHYLLTYKDAPSAKRRAVKIVEVYGPEKAAEVIRASREDYVESFGTPESRLQQLAEMLVDAIAQRVQQK